VPISFSRMMACEVNIRVTISRMLADTPGTK
jgi:hypothetical protein